MTARVYPVDAVAGAPLYAGRDLRQGTVSPFAAQGSTARPMGSLSGVRPGTLPSIVTATATTWTVNPFLGLIDAEAAAIAGAYSYSFDQVVTGGVNAAGASARTDRLDVQVDDPAEGDGSSVPAIRVLYSPGTPALAPAPARSHPLATIAVPASGGGAPTVSWTATYYAAPGGFVPFNTFAGLQLWTTAGQWQHATVRNDPTPTNNGDYIFDGTNWRLIWSDTGWITYAGAFTNGFTGRPGVLPQYRKIGNITYLSGQLYNATAPTANPVAINLPAGFRPLNTLILATVVSIAGQVQILTTGDLSIAANAARTSGIGYPLDGISFPSS
ncbi:hypothetical protein [Leifsonia sp. NPDC058248]|uniref:hypothetical protein n=1 Tax=Leifsonia sp. NPDC058248 TaxID=3346402 RepID=UPI0036DDB736